MGLFVNMPGWALKNNVESLVHEKQRGENNKAKCTDAPNNYTDKNKMQYYCLIHTEHQMDTVGQFFNLELER